MSGEARILVVDDVPPNVRLLEAVLVPRGYDVISATDGKTRAGARGVGQAGPGDARRRDAAAGRVRGVSRDPGARGHRDVAGDHDHGEHVGEDRGDPRRARTI